MNHNAHHLTGLPEFAPQTDSDAAVAALNLSLPTDAGQTTPTPSQRDDWAAAAQFYWAQAFIAMKNRDFRLMRTAAQQASDADQKASPEGALMSAIFGDAGKAPAAAVAQGRNLPIDQVAAARKAVRNNMADFAARPKPARQPVARPAPLAAPALDLPPVGTQLVLQPLQYRTIKKCGNIGGAVVWNGQAYRVITSAADGATVMITSHTPSTRFGVRFDMTAN